MLFTINEKRSQLLDSTDKRRPRASLERELGSLLDSDSLTSWAWVMAYAAILTTASVLRYHL